MTTRTDLADLHGYGDYADGPIVLTRPTVRWPFITEPRERNASDSAADGLAASPLGHRQHGDRTGGLLIACAAVLLLALAVAMGIVSWHAQFAFVFAIKHQRLAAALEALGLDCGAVVFSILGIALARLGRRAVIERALVCICAAGSMAMNAAGSDLGSPRSVAAFVMPPLLFAITSDRLISVIRRSALGRLADEESQRSAWTVAGKAALYLLRFAVAPPSTAKGGRQALLNATPLPAAALPAAESPAAITSSPRPVRSSRRAQGTRKGPTKTQRFLDLVAERHGPLADFQVADVSRVATALGPEVGLHAGSARTALKAAVSAAQHRSQQ